MKPRVLFIDDDHSTLVSLTIILAPQYDLLTTGNGADGIMLYRSRRPNLTLLDILLPGEDGFSVLRALREDPYQSPILMISALTGAQSIVTAMKLGANDYITKPFDIEALRTLVGRYVNGCRPKDGATIKTTEPSNVKDFHGLVGRTSAMQELFVKVRRVAPCPYTILLSGESGTGKELVARALHKLSLRSSRPFVALNCAALPETLIESELFGHERGSYTGADTRRLGQFEVADGGTLFLDEISELTLPLQAKLLRVLQEHEIRRIGGTHSIKVDVRVIAATNADLKDMVVQRRFRRDLFFRLSVVPIHLPPLRERQSDIPALAEYFLARSAHRLGRGPKQISDSAIQTLTRYHWPGNVRELEHVIEQACLWSDGPVLLPGHLPTLEFQGLAPRSSQQHKPAGCTSLEGAVRNLERQMILQALEQRGYVQTRAAAQLGITRRQLRYRMAALGINLFNNHGNEDDRDTPPPFLPQSQPAGPTIRQ